MAHHLKTWKWKIHKFKFSQFDSNIVSLCQYPAHPSFQRTYSILGRMRLFSFVGYTSAYIFRLDERKFALFWKWPWNDKIYFAGWLIGIKIETNIEPSSFIFKRLNVTFVDIRKVVWLLWKTRCTHTVCKFDIFVQNQQSLRNEMVLKWWYCVLFLTFIWVNKWVEDMHWSERQIDSKTLDI